MQVVIQIAWQWNMVDNVFEECHDPFTKKTYFVCLKKKSRCIVTGAKD